VLSSLIGIQQSIIEPSRAADTGGYGLEVQAYGSGVLPYQFLLTIETGSQTTKRESVASYIDATGRLQLADRHVVRSRFVRGLATGSLLEGRSFNFIKDSVGWSGFTTAPASQPITWSVCDGGELALWSSGPVLSLSIGSSGLIIGPSVTVPADGAVTSSAWVRIPRGHQIGTLRLVVSDGTASWYSTVDLTVTEVWQNVLATVAQPSGPISIGIVGTSNGVTESAVFTQCWQVEAGSSATSYIPSSMQIGFRDADVVSATVNTANAVPMLSVAVLNNAINRVIPAGSIAWLSS
jgi:hypothetical protein